MGEVSRLRLWKTGIITAVLICGLWPVAALADENAQPTDTVQQPECNSCTARHKALQKLQAARAEQHNGQDTLAVLPPPAREKEEDAPVKE